MTRKAFIVSTTANLLGSTWVSMKLILSSVDEWVLAAICEKTIVCSDMPVLVIKCSPHQIKDYLLTRDFKGEAYRTQKFLNINVLEFWNGTDFISITSWKVTLVVEVKFFDFSAFCCFTSLWHLKLKLILINCSVFQEWKDSCLEENWQAWQHVCKKLGEDG